MIRVLQVCALLVASTLIGLIIGELALRLADQSYYWAYSKRLDPVLGWRPPPGLTAWQRFEGEARVRTNSLGFRDTEHALTAPAGVFRVAVLGDSFTEAVQVGLDETWWRIMAAQLNQGACGSALKSPVEVLSFAVSGFSTAQALLAWRHDARAFKPDVVILGFFIGNDLNENLRALNTEPMRPYFIPTAQGLVLDDAFRSSPAYLSKASPLGKAWQWLKERSRILQLALQTRDAFHASRFMSASALSGQPPPPGEPGVDNALYRPPQSPAWRQSWRTTEAMLASFAGEVRQVGAVPVLMIIGTGAQVHPDTLARKRFAAILGVADLGYPVRRLLRIAEANAIPTINLPAQWTHPGHARPDHRHGFADTGFGFGHWNQRGHRAAGRAAATSVCQIASRRPD